MGILYVSTKGKAWRKHSYSAGNDYDQSPYKYYLRRVLGWKSKDDKAAFKFGRAWEEAVQFYHDNRGKGGVEDFQRRWAVHKEEPLKYTKTEKDWASLNRVGTEGMRLYMLMQPQLPIPLGGQSAFQREYSKEVFPGDPNYGEIDDVGKLDIVCYVDPKHPALPKMDWRPEWGALRPVIVDMKTGGKNFPESQGLAAYDAQLRRYSWLAGPQFRTVAFLWLTKSSSKLTKGCSVTLLEPIGYFSAGTEVVIATPPDKAGNVYLVQNDFELEQMDKAQGRNSAGKLDTTKFAETCKAEWLKANAWIAPETAVTRVRLQFNIGVVSEQSAQDAGADAARQIVEIVNSWKNNRWVNRFGVRFPRDDSKDPYFQAFVLNDMTFREQNFIKNEEENFDDLFAEEEETDGN